MRTLVSLTISLLFCSVAKGQTIDNHEQKRKHEASFDLGAFYTPTLDNHLYGANIDVKYYVYPKIATGLSLSIGQRKITDTFSYSIHQPLLNYYEIGWINQYDLLRSDVVRIGINLNNGIAISRLGDNAEKERYSTRYGYSYRAKKVATDYFYLLQPGIDASFRLFSNQHTPDVYITTKAKYRFVFGDNQYGQATDFSNYYFAVGISIIGFTDDKVKESK